MRGNEKVEAADWAVLGVLSVVWGGSFLFYRVLAFQLPPFTTVFGRCAIGAVALGAFVLLRGGTALPPRRLWGRFLLLGLINNALPFTAFAWGESRVSGGMAAILNAMTPIFTVLVTGLLLRTEPLTGARIGGVLCGFAGVAVLVGPRALLVRICWVRRRAWARRCRMRSECPTRARSQAWRRRRWRWVSLRRLRRSCCRCRCL